MLIEARLVTTYVGRMAMIGKGHEIVFQSVRNIPCLDLGGGYIGVYICTTTLSYTLKIWPLYVCYISILKIKSRRIYFQTNTYKDTMRVIYAISQEKNNEDVPEDMQWQSKEDGLWSQIDLGLNSSSATYQPCEFGQVIQLPSVSDSSPVKMGTIRVLTSEDYWKNQMR